VGSIGTGNDDGVETQATQPRWMGQQHRALDRVVAEQGLAERPIEPVREVPVRPRPAVAHERRLAALQMGDQLRAGRVQTEARRETLERLQQRADPLGQGPRTPPERDQR